MKRQAFDERRDQQIAADYHANHMACSFCGLAAERSELATYGARCLSCYRSYCDQGRHYPSLSIAQRQAMAQRVRAALGGGLRLSGRDHLACLGRLEADGRATPAQRGFLAAARRPLSAAETAPADLKPLAVDPAPIAHHAADPVEEVPDWVVEA